MGLAQDLLQQAQSLLHRERRRPKQASLRRAVSTAYYALFHLLTEEAARFLISAPHRQLLRQVVRRAFMHRNMKAVSKEFGTGRAGKFAPVLTGAPLPAELRRVAQAFADLQEARHDADYNHRRIYTKGSAEDLVTLAQRAFTNWQLVRGTLAADTYLVALLARGLMQD